MPTDEHILCCCSYRVVNNGRSRQALALAGHMAIMLLSEDNVSCEALILRHAQ